MMSATMISNTITTMSIIPRMSTLRVTLKK